ncbi:MAG: ABC transporter permease subunit [Aggregatilineales bacterium]
MAVAEDMGGSRPPPKQRRRIQLTTPGIPWYRDILVIRILMQVAFVILFVGGLGIAFLSLAGNLQESNLSLDFNIYRAPFTVAISEGPSVTNNWIWLNGDYDTAIQIVYTGIIVAILGWVGYSSYQQNKRDELPITPVLIGLLTIIFVFIAPPNEVPQILRDHFFGGSMLRAFFTGIANTIKVVVTSLIACTILGILVGIGLLSGNFLVRGVSKVFVEIFRNTPLLIQLLFIYRTMTVLLPFPRQSICQTDGCTGNNLIAMNARGLWIVNPQSTDTTVIFFVAIVIAIAVAWFVRRSRFKLQEETGTPPKIVRYTLPVLIIIPLIGWIIASVLNGGSVFINDYPILPESGPNIVGGYQITTAFFALFVGLTLYTAAFIAEIVRAGIQAVPTGQIEAARSQGLNGSQVLNLVVLPQALRLIIPPLGNQYVNLGKNSSLAIAVTYFDTYRIAQLANNESGQAVPFFVGLMAIYLVLSVTLSYLTNIVNSATKVKTR